jgi:hypothetical protein
MSPLFRRSKQAADDDAKDAGAQDVTDSQAADGAQAAGEVPQGPFDSGDVTELGMRLDMGALWLPVRRDVTMRLDVDKATGRPVAVKVSRDGSSLQIQAFAAPRTAGIWDQVREELIASAVERGGSAQEMDGPFGKEVLTELPNRTAQGREGKRDVRFFAVDGPRWLLRGRVMGRAATDRSAAKELEEVFRDVVVNRGSEARPPRELLPLTAPGARKPIETSDEDSTSLLERGPEITEVR